MIKLSKLYYRILSWPSDCKSAFEWLAIFRSKRLIYGRSFHSLSSRIPRHVVRFWLMGNFATEDEFPYLMLPATGFDQCGCSGRGYVQGRYRGNNLVYGESEYRFPISKNGSVFGGVLFVNLTTTDNPIKELHLFDAVKPGYGFGLRIMADRRSRTKHSKDFGFGENSVGFYLAASETF